MEWEGNIYRTGTMRVDIFEFFIYLSNKTLRNSGRRGQVDTNKTHTRGAQQAQRTILIYVFIAVLQHPHCGFTKRWEKHSGIKT